ncbi:MAG: hypothetical protein RLZZ28_2519 [Bacteroidota bacterium]|jgi:predicted AlkP superfamily pyrophosphatase or phosphodiesterase
MRKTIALIKKQYVVLLLLLFVQAILHAQQPLAPKRPKLVLGIVVDQMRWDYLYRYYARYSETGAFKRLLNQGFSCENTLIPYAPTLTACGHTCVYTGSVPAIHGITGNDWWDYEKNKLVYCTEDNGVSSVGSTDELGKMSPKNLLVTTIGDELRLATNFKSKVVGIAIKDRGAILPAGHSANAAYWYDNKTGDWISSTYYANELPQWVKEFNGRKLVDKYYAQDWNTLYPSNTYEQSAPITREFPRNLQQYAGKNYGVIAATPFGNSLTLEMAKATIAGEHLGEDANTDLLAVSLSSTDYIGHTYGPNSAEAEDCYLRLDKEMGEFLNYLDEKIGKDEYLIFLTADHGAAHVPAFLSEHKIPAGNFDNEKATQGLNQLLQQVFGVNELVNGIINYQVYLDREAINAKHLSKDSVYSTVIKYLTQNPAIERAFPLDAISNTTLNSRMKEVLSNGYLPNRSGDIQLIYKPQFLDGFLRGGTTHGVMNPYDAHIPLLWAGWHIKQGKSNKEVYMTDIAPTVAALLSVQMPSGSVGHVITEALK